MAPEWHLVAVVTAAFVAAASGQTAAGACQSDKLASYTVVMHTFWTRDKFPKHYPDWRPTAQFSKIIGMSHDKRWSLFSVGRSVSPQVKLFAESGRWEETGRWEAENRWEDEAGSWAAEGGQGGTSGILDQFTAPPVPQGQGRTEAQFFLDGNHSRVSLMSRIIPSPDWFVGLDSFQLCVDSSWLDTITIEVDPLDAGTDNGFTFTAPNWVTEPQGVVYRITSRFPAHPAGSFYYPYIKRLPPIATFQFIKLREYEVSETFHHSEDEKRYEVVKSDQANSMNVLRGNDVIQQEIEEEVKEQEMLLNQHQTTALDDNLVPTLPTRVTLPSVSGSLGPGIIRKGGSEALLNSYVETYHRLQQQSHANKQKFKKLKGSRDCKVGEWGEWSACSAPCGSVGEMSRGRQIVRPARRSGAPCPPLRQVRWCGAIGVSTANNCSTPVW